MPAEVFSIFLLIGSLPPVNRRRWLVAYEEASTIAPRSYCTSASLLLTAGRRCRIAYLNITGKETRSPSAWHLLSFGNYQLALLSGILAEFVRAVFLLFHHVLSRELQESQ